MVIKKEEAVKESCEVKLKLVLKSKLDRVLYDAESYKVDLSLSRFNHIPFSEITGLYTTFRAQLLEYNFECKSSQELDPIPFIEESLSKIDSMEEILTSGLQKKEKKGIIGGFSIEEVKEELRMSPGNFFFIYACANGSFSYLHPIVYKYLLQEYKERPQYLPSRIKGPISFTQVVQYEKDNLIRYKFLSHIPEYSEINFCELEVEKFLSPSSLKDLRKTMFDHKKKILDKKSAAEASTKSKSFYSGNRKSAKSDDSISFTNNFSPSPFLFDEKKE